jgi:hypothetical protein
MTITQHKILSWALGILSIMLLAALLMTLGRSNRYRVDVRYAHDIVGGFDSKRDLALRAELPQAIEYLEQLDFPEGQPSPFSGSLSYFVETQRRRAVHDVVVYLRAKTGKDLGDRAEAWIQEYGKK